MASTYNPSTGQFQKYAAENNPLTTESTGGFGSSYQYQLPQHLQQQQLQARNHPVLAGLGGAATLALMGAAIARDYRDPEDEDYYKVPWLPILAGGALGALGGLGLNKMNQNRMSTQMGIQNAIVNSNNQMYGNQLQGLKNINDEWTERQGLTGTVGELPLSANPNSLEFVPTIKAAQDRIKAFQDLVGRGSDARGAANTNQLIQNLPTPGSAPVAQPSTVQPQTASPTGAVVGTDGRTTLQTGVQQTAGQNVPATSPDMTNYFNQYSGMKPENVYGAVNAGVNLQKAPSEIQLNQANTTRAKAQAGLAEAQTATEPSKRALNYSGAARNYAQASEAPSRNALREAQRQGQLNENYFTNPDNLRLLRSNGQLTTTEFNNIAAYKAAGQKPPQIRTVKPENIARDKQGNRLYRYGTNPQTGRPVYSRTEPDADNPSHKGMFNTTTFKGKEKQSSSIPSGFAEMLGDD